MTTQSPTCKSSAHPTADVPLVQYRDGSIYAMSLSEPGRVYLVQLAPLSCTCAGFSFRGRCCHATAAVERFGQVCEHCGHSGADVDVFVNRWDNNSTIVLCTDRRACMARQGVA